MNILKNFLSKIENKKLKIVIVGDSLIDEYYAVRVNRISPEFPIPVLLSENDKPISVVPGGAANVCHQMKHWNVEAHLLSVLTSQGSQILEDHGVNIHWSVFMRGEWQMPRKKRFYDGDFPLDRWDVEAKNVNSTKTAEWENARNLLFSQFQKMTEKVNPDMVVLSDYGKGIFLKGDNGLSIKIIKHCNDNKIPVIVDPKTVSNELWSGCDIIKPNAEWARAFCDKYADEMSGNTDWKDEMKFIATSLKAKEVVLTDSGNGVGVYENDEGKSQFFKSPDLSQRRPIIRSVIGAGDCFCAFFTMAKSLGFSLKESVGIAFKGASAYIEDKHNSPVTPYMFHKWFDPIGAKKVSPEQLEKIKEQLPNQKWVWTNGCFDLIHTGHLKTFEEAKRLGDKLVIGLNTDESVQSLKGEKRPILPFSERESLLAHLQYVDFVVPIKEKTPASIIEKITPNVIVKGGDYQVKDIAGHEVVGEENVHIIPLIEGISTSKIIERIKDA